MELPTSENANEGSDSCSVKHSEAMRVAVRQRATETSSAGIRRCAYLLPSTRVFAPPTLRRSACCLNATKQFTAIHPRFRPTDLASVGLLPDRYKAPGQFRSPPTLRRSACCLKATRQRAELPTSENANEGSDSCSVKHSEAMRVAVRQRATETISAGIRRCAYLLPSTRVFAPPTLRRSACCLTATKRPGAFPLPTDLASVGLLPDRYKAPGAIPLPTDLASVGLLPESYKAARGASDLGKRQRRQRLLLGQAF